MEQSAGTLLYRAVGDDLEVLLVHPSGDYNRRAPWSIPKGVPDPGETLEDAARRETCEEASVRAASLFSLGYIDYRSGRKRVHCFAGPAPDTCQPQCGSWEVDQARFVLLDDARRLLHRDQVEFLNRLEAHLRPPPGRS